MHLVILSRGFPTLFCIYLFIFVLSIFYLFIYLFINLFCLGFALFYFFLFPFPFDPLSPLCIMVRILQNRAHLVGAQGRGKSVM